MRVSARHIWTSPFRYFVVSALMLVVLGVASLLLTTALRMDGATLSRALLGSGREETWFAIKLTVWVTTGTTVVAVLFGIPAGYALSRYRFPLHVVIDTLIDLPIVLPPIVAGIVLLVFFTSSTGEWTEANVGRLVYTQQGIILAQLLPAGSFAVRALKAAFDSVHPRMEQVARTLGCNERQAFWRVVLPQARNGLIAGAVMTWARAAGEFGSILIFCGATKMKTETLPIAVFLNMNVGDLGMVISLTMILVVLSTTGLLVFKWLGGRGYLW